MNRLKIIASSFLMASMLSTASIASQFEGDHASINVVNAVAVDPVRELTATEKLDQLQLMAESCKPNNGKYAWMRSEDLSKFESLMSRQGAIGGRGRDTPEQKYDVTLKWLENQKNIALYEILHKNITEADERVNYFRPEEFNLISSADSQDFRNAMLGDSVKPSEKLTMARNWYDSFKTKFAELETLLNRLSMKQHDEWMIAEDYTAFDADKTSNTWVENSIADSYISSRGVSEKIETYKNWLANRHQFRTGMLALAMTANEQEAFNAAKTSTTWVENSISDMYQGTKSPVQKLTVSTQWLEAYRQNQTDINALEQFVTSMSEVELEAFNTAKSSMTGWWMENGIWMENSISDMYQSTKSPAEKLAVYTPWLNAYRQNQASIIALEQFATNMSAPELEAFNTAKASRSWINTLHNICDVDNSTKSPIEKLAMYKQWLEAYRQAQA